jgi:dTDP-4-amino-4,6-dideoxygalactose transaminase
MAELCCRHISAMMGGNPVMLTPSGTAALEMAALLLNIGPGDEVIIPAFTHYSVANAFILRGASAVFVDVDEKSLNIDPVLAEAAVTGRTRAIAAVHYGGTSCDLDALLSLTRKPPFPVLIEDNALSLGSTYRSRMLGSFGTFACLSFHSGKNITAGGEGGALILADESYLPAAQIIREMGTNRAAFRRGETERFSWKSCGSSYLLSELSAAFLSAQLEAEEQIRRKRAALFAQYRSLLAPLEERGLALCSRVPDYNTGNGHLFYIRSSRRSALERRLGERGVETAAHYPSLPRTPFAQTGTQCSTSAPTPVSDAAEFDLLRLPLYPQLTGDEVRYICAEILDFFSSPGKDGLSHG